MKPQLGLQLPPPPIPASPPTGITTAPVAFVDRTVQHPGFGLEPTTFTPTSSPAAPEPKYRDQECAGFRVRVTDPTVVPFGPHDNDVPAHRH